MARMWRGLRSYRLSAVVLLGDEWFVDAVGYEDVDGYYIVD